jgi:hypothetical protein
LITNSLATYYSAFHGRETIHGGEDLDQRGAVVQSALMKKILIIIITIIGFEVFREERC